MSVPLLSSRGPRQTDVPRAWIVSCHDDVECSIALWSIKLVSCGVHKRRVLLLDESEKMKTFTYRESSNRRKDDMGALMGCESGDGIVCGVLHWVIYTAADIVGEFIKPSHNILREVPLHMIQWRSSGSHDADLPQLQ